MILTIWEYLERIYFQPQYKNSVFDNVVCAVIPILIIILIVLIWCFISALIEYSRRWKLDLKRKKRVKEEMRKQEEQNKERLL